MLRHYWWMSDLQNTAAVAVELVGVTKLFPGVIANDGIDLKVRTGEIHAIVGENGCGKSTLMNMLYGMYRPNDGQIKVFGNNVSFESPADAIAVGIGMVHQHVMLADNLTVLENVILGSEPSHHWHDFSLHHIDHDEARDRIVDISRSYGSPIDVDRRCGDLGVGERQFVEIVKVLYRGAKILILDEPTSALVPQEVDQLLANLRQLKATGVTILFISHKLNEVLAIADSISVLRSGRMVTTVPAHSVDARSLAELMVGSELPSPASGTKIVNGSVILKLDHVDVYAPSEPQRLACNDATFDVHCGEIVGIAGVKGNGQEELIEAVMGLIPISRGSLTFDADAQAKDITNATTRERREMGIGYIPGDRQRQGLLMGSPLWENALLGHQTAPESTNGPGDWFIDADAVRAHTETIVEMFDVKTPNIDVRAQALSGGNQQKLVVGRELSAEPRLLIAAHPTLGVDVGAQASIWDQLREARDKGMGVVLISADLDELIGLADKLVVMFGGRIVATLDPAKTTPKELGSYMTGAS
jgi:general nucleoside transport system ATP-binding protein